MVLKLFFIIVIAHIIFFISKALYLYVRNIKLVKGIPNNVQAVSFHTYKPKNSIIPKRGQMIAHYAYQIAETINVPIILSVGNRVPNEPRMESEIYRDYIFNNHGTDIPIITRSGSKATDTNREVRESFTRCQELNIKSFGVIGLIPHLVLRIIPYWQKINVHQNVIIYFDGIIGPPQYIFWEFVMMILENYIPPNSKQRKFILNLVNRRG